MTTPEQQAQFERSCKAEWMAQPIDVRNDELEELKLAWQRLYLAARKVVRVHGNGQPKQMEDAVLLLNMESRFFTPNAEINRRRSRPVECLVGRQRDDA